MDGFSYEKYVRAFRQDKNTIFTSCICMNSKIVELKSLDSRVEPGKFVECSKQRIL